jgi:2-polyprenyl-3-methyl-5-hydroxy-6-metoxy-1,4-benzoquinol methylase
VQPIPKTPPESAGASFRDPDGRLLLRNGRVIRLVRESGTPALCAFLASRTAEQFTRDGRLVRTDLLRPEQFEAAAGDFQLEDFPIGDAAMVLEHEKVPFPSYSWEWPPEMLHAAAALTLDLAEALAPESLGLKDATPHNVLFHGPNPVFIDVLSIEQRDPGDPTWLPYAQFNRTFLLPLLANRRFGTPLDQIFLTRRDGIEPGEICRLAGPLRKWLPPFLTQATIPHWLGRKAERGGAETYRRKISMEPAKTAFILQSMFRQLRRTLGRVEPPAQRDSVWSGYMGERPSYTGAEFEAKSNLVQQALAELRPGSVLDVGCNTGHFSALAARSGASVVSIDYDSAVVGQVWIRARTEKLDILPLVVDLTRPTPATGWRNAESPSFLSRARGAFDCVLMLAVLHHMLITERIPLDEMITLAAELTRRHLVIEFVEQPDPMFQRLLRGRGHLHRDLTPERFEAAARRRFEIIRSQRSGRHRVLYLLARRDAADA